MDVTVARARTWYARGMAGGAKTRISARTLWRRRGGSGKKRSVCAGIALAALHQQ
jgi:hypothetical protein